MKYDIIITKKCMNGTIRTGQMHLFMYRHKVNIYLLINTNALKG